MDKLKNKKFRAHFDKIDFVHSKDFEEVIEMYDSPTTYFYLDPPYYKTEDYYSAHDFDVDDHGRLCGGLHHIQGKFGLSYYEFDKLSEWLPKDEFTWESKGFAKAAAARDGVPQNIGTELLIMNYTPEVVIEETPTRKPRVKKEVEVPKELEPPKEETTGDDEIYDYLNE